MKHERVIKHKEWTITIEVVHDGFNITAAKDGFVLSIDKANPGRLHQRVLQMKNIIDHADETLKVCIQELKDVKE